LEIGIWGLGFRIWDFALCAFGSLIFMRLCIVSPFPPEISGVGQYGWNVTHGLAGAGHFRAITVLAGDNPSPWGDEPRESGLVSVRRLWSRDDPRVMTRLLRAIKAERPDVLWFNLGFTVFGASRVINFFGLAAPMLARQMGFPVVVTLHEIFEAAQLNTLGLRNGHLTAWGAQAATRMLLHADVVCVTLQRYRRELEARYGARNVRHLPIGAYTSPEFLARPLDAPPHNILIFATFAPYKGLPLLLQAFEQVRRNFPEATLTVAGSDHPRFPGYLAAMRASMNGAAGIHWLGPQSEPELRESFARASVVVAPYLATTGSSSVIHRAAAFGRPLVVSDLPEMRVLAQEENLRMDYAPPAEAAALADTLTRLLSDPQRQTEMAQHNLAVLQKMTLDHTCARYIEFFGQAIHSRKLSA
jgi:glycosyltransferase involved in cell wall biosynthesis